jgi:hypothetical protein
LRKSRSYALVLALALVAGQANAESCFTQDEAKAANFRALQQQFTVAALSCRMVNAQPGDPDYVKRYNLFVERYGAQLRQNALVLRAHFQRAGGNIDDWITKIANVASRNAGTDAKFCQAAWENLEAAIYLPSQDIEAWSEVVAAAGAYAPACATDATRLKTAAAAAVTASPQPALQ